uniref:Top1 n=1 Tax=Arundo donax TaxID=35708 RepID=A0A0A9EPW3_ARUDO
MVFSVYSYQCYCFLNYVRLNCLADHIPKADYLGWRTVASVVAASKHSSPRSSVDLKPQVSGS